MGTDVADQVRRRIGVPVCMAVEAGDTERRLGRATIVGEIELLLGKRDNEEAQTLELLWIQNAFEETIVVLVRHQLALRYVTQVRTRGQKNRGRELREETIGEVELEIEAFQIALRLLEAT